MNLSVLVRLSGTVSAGALFLNVAAVRPVSAAEAGPVSFVRDVAPVLNQKCVTCHGPEKARGGYRVDSFEAMLKSGDSGKPPVAAGNPERSHLFQLLITADADDRMPQKDDPLAAAQIETFQRWIEQGAVFDGRDTKAPLASLVPRPVYPDPPESYPIPVPVRALAFSPDGKEIAASGYHEVTFWSANDGALLRRVKNLPRHIQSLCYSADGSLLAVAGGSPGQSGEVVLVDVASAEIKNVLATYPDVPSAVAFDPGGARLAAGGADGSIRLFEIPGGREALSLPPHADWVLDLAFSQDGARLASASRDRSARVFSSSTGELEATYMDHSAPVHAVAFSANGQHVYSAGRDKEIHVWKTEDAKKAAEIGGFDGEIFALLIADGNIFSASADGEVRQHAGKDRKLIRKLSGHRDRVYALALHPDRQRLAAGSHDGEVRVWSVQTGEPTLTFKAAPGAR